MREEGSPPPQLQLQQGQPLPPDKIIIYSDFLSSFWVIKLVSDCSLFVTDVRADGLMKNRYWRRMESRW